METCHKEHYIACSEFLPVYSEQIYMFPMQLVVYYESLSGICREFLIYIGKNFRCLLHGVRYNEIPLYYYNGIKLHACMQSKTCIIIILPIASSKDFCQKNHKHACTNIY